MTKIIDDNDKCWTGNPTIPEIIYGFGFSLKYKGFDCSAFFQGQGKISIIMYDCHPFATKATARFGTDAVDRRRTLERGEP